MTTPVSTPSTSPLPSPSPLSPAPQSTGSCRGLLYETVYDLKTINEKVTQVEVWHKTYYYSEGSTAYSTTGLLLSKLGFVTAALDTHPSILVFNDGPSSTVTVDPPNASAGRDSAGQCPSCRKTCNIATSAAIATLLPIVLLLIFSAGFCLIRYRQLANEKARAQAQGFWAPDAAGVEGGMKGAGESGKLDRIEGNGGMGAVAKGVRSATATATVGTPGIVPAPAPTLSTNLCSAPDPSSDSAMDPDQVSPLSDTVSQVSAPWRANELHCGTQWEESEGEGR